MKNKIKICFGIGAPSILMIFVSLCITVLATLSLITVNSNYNLAKKSAAYVKSYYEADCLAEEWLSETYEVLNKGIILKNNIFTVPISNNQSLELIIDIEANDFKIISQRVIFAEEWDYSEFGPKFTDIK